MNQQALSALIWSVADLLRGDFKQSEYGRVILPFTVLRRLDCVLAPTKAAVLAEYREKKEAGLPFEPFVLRKSSATPPPGACCTSCYTWTRRSRASCWNARR